MRGTACARHLVQRRHERDAVVDVVAECLPVLLHSPGVREHRARFRPAGCGARSGGGRARLPAAAEPSTAAGVPGVVGARAAAQRCVCCRKRTSPCSCWATGRPKHCGGQSAASTWQRAASMQTLRRSQRCGALHAMDLFSVPGRGKLNFLASG